MKNTCPNCESTIELERVIFEKKGNIKTIYCSECLLELRTTNESKVLRGFATTGAIYSILSMFELISKPPSWVLITLIIFFFALSVRLAIMNHYKIGSKKYVSK